MKAVIVPRLGDPSVLRVDEWPSQPPERNEVRIGLHAGGVNYTDLMVIAGTYQRHYEPPFVLGTEGAGVVLECGRDVSQVRAGDRVLVQNNVGRGCFADEVTAVETRVCPLPAAVSFVDAAACAINYGTAYYALTTRGQLQGGETLVVHGASGGVGIAAVQVGKRLGARVIATGTDDRKLAEVAREGADATVNIVATDLAQAVLDLTDGRGADVVLDTVGGDVFDASMKSIAVDGRLLIVGFVSGHIPQIAANRILFKGIAVVGVPYGGFTERNPQAWRRNMTALLDMLAAGLLRPRIYRCAPLEDVRSVLDELSQRRVLGKSILYTEAGRSATEAFTPA
jgi:NADPH2:quinone reductase